MQDQRQRLLCFFALRMRYLASLHTSICIAFCYAVLNSSGWGVSVIAFTQKHDGNDHVPSAQIMVAVLAIGPKENEVTIACCLSTFIWFAA